MAKSDVKVSVVSVQPSYAYGQPLQLDYTLENRSSGARWVVVDPFLASAEGSGELHIFLGEDPIPKGWQYFEYEAPELKKLAPGAKFQGHLRVAMPLIRAEADEEIEVTLSGVVRVILKVGFLKSAFRPRSANPWGEFLAAQEISAEARTRVKIAAP